MNQPSHKPQSPVPISVTGSNRLPIGYYDAVFQNKRGMRSAWHRIKFARVRDLIPYGESSLLDIGCAAGSFLGTVPESQSKYQVGFDVDPSQIEYANATYGTPFRKFVLGSQLRDLNLENQFDIVTMIEVIEHLQGPLLVATLEKAYRCLKPGGVFIVTTPNYSSCWPILELIVDRMTGMNYAHEHVTKFSYRTMERQFFSIVPHLHTHLKMEFVTTTHLISPFLGIVSAELADWSSQILSHSSWRVGLGNLMIAKFRKEPR